MILFFQSAYCSVSKKANRSKHCLASPVFGGNRTQYQPYQRCPNFTRMSIVIRQGWFTCEKLTFNRYTIPATPETFWWRVNRVEYTFWKFCSCQLRPCDLWMQTSRSKLNEVEFTELISKATNRWNENKKNNFLFRWRRLATILLYFRCYDNHTQNIKNVVAATEMNSWA